MHGHITHPFFSSPPHLHYFIPTDHLFILISYPQLPPQHIQCHIPFITLHAHHTHFLHTHFFFLSPFSLYTTTIPISPHSLIFPTLLNTLLSLSSSSAPRKGHPKPISEPSIHIIFPSYLSLEQYRSLPEASCQAHHPRIFIPVSCSWALSQFTWLQWRLCWWKVSLFSWVSWSWL